MLRRIGVAVGFASFGLSLISFVVPVLPTVPLLILTCFIFSKTSPRWHAWLLEHKQFGRPLRLWEEHGVIALRVKVTTTTIMTLCLVHPIFFGSLSAFARWWIATCAVGVFGFLWSRP